MHVYKPMSGFSADQVLHVSVVEIWHQCSSISRKPMRKKSQSTQSWRLWLWSGVTPGQLFMLRFQRALKLFSLNRTLFRLTLPVRQFSYLCFTTSVHGHRSVVNRDLNLNPQTAPFPSLKNKKHSVRFIVPSPEALKNVHNKWYNRITC